ncbi:MAG: hypothetical protein JST16_05305 [Bdellovibrionales bacterium]|nr:hypothetical protein [Bdellovibrionales bacterium]
MSESSQTNDPGNETMKQVGTLDEIVRQAAQDKRSCAAEPEEVASWITAIGRAIRAIFSL